MPDRTPENMPERDRKSARKECEFECLDGDHSKQSRILKLGMIILWNFQQYLVCFNLYPRDSATWNSDDRSFKNSSVFNDEKMLV